MELVGLENEDDDDLVDNFDIKTLANLIVRPLTDGFFQYRAGAQEQLLYRKPIQNQLFELQGQIAASII